MPNWSWNNLILEGSKYDLEKFYNDNKSDILDDGEFVELSFNKAVKRPKEEENNWYEWNCRNWGTKWDARYISVSKEKKYNDKEIINTLLVFKRKLSEEVQPIIPIIKELFSYSKYNYSFDTAWGPPIPWLEFVSKKYKNIKFDLEFNVEGFDNGGKIVLKGDDILLQESWNTSDKIYEDNKQDINNIIKGHLTENEINYNNLSKDETDDLIDDLSQILFNEGYFINENNICDSLYSNKIE